MIDFDDLDEVAAERVAEGDEVAAKALGFPEGPDPYKGGYLWPIPRSKYLPDFDALPEKLGKNFQWSSRGILVRLILFYGAGDSFPFWAGFMQDCPEWAEVAVYEWPRHGTREDEELPSHVDGFVEDAMQGLKAVFKQHAKDGPLEGAPVALAGHSIGVLIMLGVAERARALFGIEPCAVFIMDRAAPQYPLCSDFGAKLLEEDAKDFIRIFNPQVYAIAAAAKDGDKAKSQKMLQMWMDDIKFQQNTKPEGFHLFRCPLHVFVAMGNWSMDSEEVTSKLDPATLSWHAERCAILGSKPSSQALWDRGCYNDWRAWSSEPCQIYEIHVDHAALKRDKNFLRILFAELEKCKASKMAHQRLS